MVVSIITQDFIGHPHLILILKLWPFQKGLLGVCRPVKRIIDIDVDSPFDGTKLWSSKLQRGQTGAKFAEQTVDYF